MLELLSSPSNHETTKKKEENFIYNLLSKDISTTFNGNIDPKLGQKWLNHLEMDRRIKILKIP